MTTPHPEALTAALDGIRDEVRDAVLEGDAQDCSSADCIADAVYEIVRVRLIGEAADAPLDVETAAAARAWLAGDTKGLNGAMTDLAARLTDGDG